jgi:hypothetical protein
MEHSYAPLHAGPFGTPDGARASIDLIESSFVDFGDKDTFGALSTRPDDASVRVIVGTLGSGKTVYMRRLNAYQSHERSVYADHVQQRPPTTETVVLASDWFRERLAENWKLLWGRAIIRALATHMFASSTLSGNLDATAIGALKRDYEPIIGSFRRPRSVYDELNNIIENHNSANHLNRYLNNPAWSDLEYELAETLADAPPVFFYLDAIDETWASAPAYWMRCQEGLFLQVMDLLRHPRLGGRLHVCIGLRDIVLSSIFRSEHGPRYRDEPHIRILDWNRPAIEHLLNRKLAQLAPDFFMAPSSASPPRVDDWLGTRWIYNEKRGIDEDILDYVLRHTRLIPRDLVILGNSLCRLVAQEKLRGKDEIEPKLLRSTVARCARGFAESQLAQCSAEIAAATMPRNVAQQGGHESYLDNEEYVDWISGQLHNVIGGIGVDRFGWDELQLMRSSGRGVFGSQVDVATIMWQSGLLGYVTGDRQCAFYSLASASSFALPERREQYVLHPCCLDGIPDLQSVGPDPVRPYVWNE